MRYNNQVRSDRIMRLELPKGTQNLNKQRHLNNEIRTSKRYTNFKHLNLNENYVGLL